jgi:BolA protein
VGAVARTMEAKLRAGLSPDHLEIVDESHLHAGHTGARSGGESHFAVSITAAEFTGLSRLQRQRMVYRLLADELAGGVHALTLKVLAPGEG